MCGQFSIYIYIYYYLVLTIELLRWVYRTTVLHYNVLCIDSKYFRMQRKQFPFTPVLTALRMFALQDLAYLLITEELRPKLQPQILYYVGDRMLELGAICANST